MVDGLPARAPREDVLLGVRGGDAERLLLDGLQRRLGGDLEREPAPATKLRAVVLGGEEVA